MKKILFILLFAITTIFADKIPEISPLKNPVTIDSDYTVTFDSSFGYTRMDSLEEAIRLQSMKFGWELSTYDTKFGVEIMRELNRIDDKLKVLDTLKIDVDKIMKMFHISTDTH